MSTTTIVTTRRRSKRIQYAVYKKWLSNKKIWTENAAKISVFARSILTATNIESKVNICIELYRLINSVQFVHNAMLYSPRKISGIVCIYNLYIKGPTLLSQIKTNIANKRLDPKYLVMFTKAFTKINKEIRYYLYSIVDSICNKPKLNYDVMLLIYSYI
jgi:hypothetical protein